MRKLLINITLFLVAMVLLFILAGFWLVSGIIVALTTDPTHTVKSLSNYFRRLAIWIDQFWNVLLWPFFNLYAINNSWYKFWNQDETISKVLKENHKTKNLQKLWKALYYIIDLIDPWHFEWILD